MDNSRLPWKHQWFTMTPPGSPSQAPALQALVVCARRGDLAQLSNHAMLRQKVLTLEAIELGGCGKWPIDDFPSQKAPLPPFILGIFSHNQMLLWLKHFSQANHGMLTTDQLVWSTLLYFANWKPWGSRVNSKETGRKKKSPEKCVQFHHETWMMISTDYTIWQTNTLRTG